MVNRNKQVVERLTLGLLNDGGDVAGAQRLLAPDFADRAAPPGAADDRQAFVSRALALREMLPGLRTETEQLVAEGDMVTERWRRTFQQTGRPMEVVGFSQYRLRHGLIVESFAPLQVATLAPRETDDLTPGEMRVAILVAEGLTNPEVARELGVSRKTVEYHLSQIYRKMGVRSRLELTRSLAPHLDWQTCTQRLSYPALLRAA
jgi:DNA-binding CsgD family transcriptional regulator